MLDRPGLLLNPWVLRDTDTGRQQAATGGQYKDASGREPPAETASRPAGAPTPSAVSDPANLDFLSDSGVLLANLVPNETGVVRIPKDQLNRRQDLHIVAVGPTDAVFRRVSLPDAGVSFRDLRVARPLEVSKHFTERKEAALLQEGDELTIPDLRTAEMQAYDTLGSIYSLYLTRTGNATLAEFRFVIDWDALDEEQRRAKYSKYASHELNFFLSRKDPVFFQEVIVPYLRNKKDKTFMDRYLLNEDLHRFIDPWRYSRLNMAERVLLADRLGDEERDVAKRHLSDLLALIPPNPAERDSLFFTALRGQSLSLSDGVGGGAEFLTEAEDAEMDGAENRGVRFRRRQLGNGVDDTASEEAVVQAAPSSRAAAPPMSNAALMELEGVGNRALLEREMENKRQRLTEEFGRRSRLSATLGFADDKASDLLRRRESRSLYRKLPAVKEWAENNYYHVPIENPTAELVPINAFWRDYATHLAK
ncbi:MAG: hypothetical protein AAF961_14565, partial [Planctomycetota bacterium]